MNISIIDISETDSTNHYLRELNAENRLPEGTVVSTDFQTAGRGQMGNTWESERGCNLMFSMLLRPAHIQPAQQFIISQIVSLGVVEVLDDYGNGFSIKWPNDIYWNDKKIAGILIENDLAGKTIFSTVVGIGLNVNQQKFCSSAPNPVSLVQISGNTPIDRRVLLDSITQQIGKLYESYRCGEDTEIAFRYASRLYHGAGYYDYEAGGQRFSAKISRVEESGHLVLLTSDGIERKFAFKEVSFLF